MVKYYFLLIVIALVTAACPAATTIFQPWDVNDWTLQLGSNAHGEVVITPRPDDANYLYANIWRNMDGNSVTSIYVSLGDANIPAGTVAGDVNEFWLEYDYRPLGGDTGKYAVMFGVFDSEGDNDNDPNNNWIGIQNTGAGRVQATVRNQAGTVSCPNTIYGDINLEPYRLKAHVYNSGGKTLMDVNLYSIDANTLALTDVNPSQWISGFVVLDTGQSFDKTIDVLGVRNTIGPLSASIEIDYDNMYFSTEGPKTGSVPYPFVKVCNDDTGDYNGDCKVNFKDFALMAGSWMECAYIPTRLCE